MGNCICITGKTRTSISIGESYDKRSRKRNSTVFHEYKEDEEKLLELSNVRSPSSLTVRREVKIRMTKKELENLMQDIDMMGLTPEEILSTLLSDGANQIGFDVEHIDHHRHWRPALQSIPEID